MAPVSDSSLMDDPAEGIRDFPHCIFPIRLSFAAFSLGVYVGVMLCKDQYSSTSLILSASLRDLSSL